MTRAYAEVIGDPIAQSKSPIIHGFWLNALGIEAEYRRTLVTADDLPAFIDQRRADPAWRGCNITMPHKLAALGHVDDLDMSAQTVGAVNLVGLQNGRLIGYNTDVDGVAGPLSRPDRTIGGYADHVATYTQVIGAGGAARAAAAATRTDLEFYNRDSARAVALAVEYGLPEWYGQGLEALGPIRNQEDRLTDQRYSHIVINATSMGMIGQPPVPIDLSIYYPDTIVFDMVYAPIETPLLKQARAFGLRTVDGLEMLVGQAARAFEIFFGSAPPREGDEELRELLLR